MFNKVKNGQRKNIDVYSMIMAWGSQFEASTEVLQTVMINIVPMEFLEDLDPLFARVVPRLGINFMDKLVHIEMIEDTKLTPLVWGFDKSMRHK